MWNVPHIQFVKDITEARLLEVEERLSRADMGPDYQPTSIVNRLKHEPSLVQPSVSKDRLKDCLGSFVCTPGPGGSVEVTSHPTSDRLSAADDLEDSGFGDTFDSFQKSSADIDLSKVKTSSRYLKSNDKCLSGAKDDDVVSSTISRFRSDIYGIDHRSLYQQTVELRNRLRMRNTDKTGQQQIDDCQTSD